MIIKRTYSELLNEAVVRLSANTELTNIVNNGSSSRAILEVICGRLSEIYEDFASNLEDANVSSSSGSKLDLFAASLGLSRRLGESDENLRYRITRYWQSANRCNFDALRLELLDIDNIRNVLFRENIMGLGSYGVYLVPTTGSISQTTLTEAQDVLDEYEAMGVHGVALVPTEIPVSLSVKVISTTDSYLVKEGVKNNIAFYISNLDMGEELIYNKIIDVAFNASSDIVDIQISDLYINGQEVLKRNYKPEFDEILRPSVVEVI